MSLTRIGSIGINTGIAFAGVTTIVTLNTANDALSIGATVNVGSGITLGASGDGFFTGVVTATSYVGDGSALTGIAATDNVRTGILDVAGVGTFRNDVNIPDKIVHLGDTNTAIRFPADNQFTVETGGSQRMSLSSSGMIFNETGEDVDFRIESDSQTHMFFVDAGNNKIGVNVDTPLETLHAKGSLYITLSGSNANEGNAIKFQTKSGGFDTSYGAAIHGLRVGDASSYLRFDTGGQSEKMRLDSNGQLSLGTSTARQKLHIHASDSGASNMVFTNTTTGSAAADGFVVGITGAEDAQLNMQESASIKFSTADTERLTIGADSNITQTIDTDGDGFIITAGDMKPMLTGNSNRSAENNTIFGISGKWNGTEVGRIAFEAGADTTNKDDGRIRFYTRKSGGSLTQRAMIDDEGRMGILTNSPDATLHIGSIIDNHPVLLLQGGGSTTGDLTVPAAENLQVGHWDSSSNTYTNRFQINTSTGNVTMPSQACMVFVDPVDISTVSNANGHNLDPIHFNTQHINQGGVSSSNTKSRITVPTAGTYLIQGLLSGSLTTASAGDGIQIKIKRNGSVYPDGNMWPAEGMGDFAGKEYAFSFSVPVTLALNDYVELCYDNIGGSIQYNLAYGYFAVTLLH